MREYIVPIYDDSPNHDEIFVGYIRENAAEVVRCENCVFFESGIRCGLRNEQTDYNDFCSKGRRKS